MGCGDDVQSGVRISSQESAEVSDGSFERCSVSSLLETRPAGSTVSEWKVHSDIGCCVNQSLPGVMPDPGVTSPQRCAKKLHSANSSAVRDLKPRYLSRHGIQGFL